jgi:hypothetical protein
MVSNLRPSRPLLQDLYLLALVTTHGGVLIGWMRVRGSFKLSQPGRFQACIHVACGGRRLAGSRQVACLPLRGPTANGIGGQMALGARWDNPGNNAGGMPILAVCCGLSTVDVLLIQARVMRPPTDVYGSVYATYPTDPTGRRQAMG